jgi:hypothetical protein
MAHIKIGTRRSIGAAVVLWVASTASAQAPTIPGLGNPVKPRVMIIFDTSSSMQVAPDDKFGVVFPMNMPGGDYDPLNAGAPCYSKFCIAKNVVYNTLPQYDADARIGLATYFQFLVQYTGINTQSTTCYYDKMFKPGYTGPETTFKSTVDYTGGAESDVGATSSTPVFPASNVGAPGTGSLANRCTDPATLANRHVVTKTKAKPPASGQVLCADFSYFPQAGVGPGPRSVPFTYGAIGTPAPVGWNGYTSCNLTNSYYRVYANPTVVNQTSVPGNVTSMYTVQYINQSNNNNNQCPPQAIPGVNPPSLILSNPSLGNGTGSWDGMLPGECPPSAPCAMWSTSSTSRDDAANFAWFGLEPSGWNTDMGPATWPQSATSFGGANYGNKEVQGNIVNFPGATCPTTGGVGIGVQFQVTTGTWGDYGITKALTDQVLKTQGNQTDKTPGLPNPTCDTNLVCYLTLISQTSTGNTWGPWANINYNMPAAGAGEQIQGPVTADNNGNAHYRKTGTCGGPITTTAATTTPGSTPDTGWLPGYFPTAGATCGTGRQTCAFINPTNATMNTGCQTPVTQYDGNVPPACNGNDQVSHTYSPSGGATTYTYSINVGVGGTCPATGSTQTSPAPCSGGSPCKVQTSTPGVGPAATSSPTFNALTPPSGYTGAPTTTVNLATNTWSTPSASGSPCPPTGSQQSSDATVCGGNPTPCTVLSLGLMPFGPPIGETQPQKCEYTLQQFTWTAPTTTCTIVVPQQAYTTASTFPVCEYDLTQYQLRTQTAPQVACQYSAPIARFDYKQTSRKFCEYARYATVYEATPYTYTYQWTTSGGELWSYLTTTAGNPWANPGNTGTLTNQGQHTEYVGGTQLCSLPYSDTATGGFTTGGACPRDIDNCDGNSSFFCRLRWGNPIAGSTTLTGSGRYTLSYALDSRLCMAPDYNQTAAWKVNIPTYGGAGGVFSTNTFVGDGTDIDPNTPNIPIATSCQSAGVPPGHLYSLYSDWYQPGMPNTGPTVANIGPLPAGYVSALWTNQATKESGWSAIGGTPTVAPSPSEILVPIPLDTDPTGGDATLRAALDKCDPPSNSNVDPVTLKWTTKGACMVNDYYRNPTTTPSELHDFTPLYGSLLNANKYLSDLKANDPDALCRPYYVVLATDGLESTPAGFKDPDLASAVGTLFANNVQTYVIGFGNEVTGTASTSLDQMAAAGGTVKAFIANDANSLSTEFNQVLSHITQGTFSRSKPTISTDGTRIYAAQFTRASNSPEWKGELFAFAIDQTTGQLSQKWEYSKKLNVQDDSTRSISTDVAGASPVLQDFNDTNTTVLNTLTTDPGFPAGLTGGQVVDFIRNPGVPTSSFASYYSLSGTAPVRTSRAADILHASAVVVSNSPYSADWGGTTTVARTAFTNWQNNTAINRPPRVIFGADDGMVHSLYERSDTTANPDCAINENLATCPNGSEAWGFVPSGLQQKLYKDTMGYNAGVDNTLAVADVCGTVSGGVSSDAASCTAADWTTVAIGTLREGGRQLFGLQMTPTGTMQWNWNYTDSMLGNTWSVPSIGRVSVGGAQHFIAVFGGGVLNCPTCAGIGSSMYMLDALSGQEYGKFSPVGLPSNQLPARPATFRRPAAAFMDSATAGGIDGVLYVARFADANGNQYGNASSWTPGPFFDPTNASDKNNVLGVATPIMTVVTLPTTPPTYALVPVTTGDLTLPLTTGAPPLYNQPKVAALYDGTGNTGDYFIGTGDALNPSTPSVHTNYFYAIHDRDQQGGSDDGQPLWVVRFPNYDEQVVSTPAIISGAVIVATYVPPGGGAQCSLNGDTYLYAFDPVSGALTPALVTSQPNPNNPNGPPQTTSVMKLTNVGIPSDLLVVGDTLYMSTSNGGIMSTPVKPKPTGGDIRSFRRLR